jgi:hypothetical protein
VDYKVEINTATLSSDVRSAWRETTTIMAEEFRAVIDEPIWAWPRGENPRDIVDTGDLRDSQRLDQISEDEAKYSWPVPYSLIVHNGARLRNGGDYPARPWTKRAIARRNPHGVFSKLLAAKL